MIKTVRLYKEERGQIILDWGMSCGSITLQGKITQGKLLLNSVKKKVHERQEVRTRKRGRSKTKCMDCMREYTRKLDVNQRI